MKIDVPRAFFRLYLKNKTMSSDKIDMNSVNNILVMSNTAIGDTLFATSSLTLINERYPDKKIILALPFIAVPFFISLFLPLHNKCVSVMLGIKSSI